MSAQAVISECPELVRSGVFDLMTGLAPIHAAARGGNPDAVKAVLKAGADIEARDGNGWTALRVSRTHADSMLCAGWCTCSKAVRLATNATH